MGNQDHGLDAAASERLLDGPAGRPGGGAGGHERLAELLAMAGGHERLAELLAMAAAPASPAELAGEDAAAVFRAGHVTNVPATNAPVPAHRAPRPTWGRRLLTVKTGAVALALAAGGVALATGTGVLPGEPDGTPAPSQATLTGATTSKPPARSATGGAPYSPGNPGSETAQPSASPALAPMLMGLCTAHLARVSRGHEVRDTPEFATLAAAAGGAELVTDFCQTLLDQVAGTSGHSGGNPAHQTGLPSPKPSGQPGGPNQLDIPHRLEVPAQPDVPTQDPPTP